MKIYTEKSLADFEWWSGAKDTAETIEEKLGEKGWEQLDSILEEQYPDGIDETELNDLLWFEPEIIYEWLGIAEEEEEEEEEIDYTQGETEHDAQIFERFCTPQKDCEKCPYDNKCKTIKECYNRFYQILADYCNKEG